MGGRVPAFDPAISLAELETLCRLPAPCGAPLECAGRTVTIRGYVDSRNIFNKQISPRTPYEKFRLVDENGRAIEVWAQSADNKPIFDKLAGRPSDDIRVTGRLESFDMPITGRCVRGIKMVIDHASQIQFQ